MTPGAGQPEGGPPGSHRKAPGAPEAPEQVIEETRVRDDPVKSGGAEAKDDECHAKKDEDRRMHHTDHGISRGREKNS